MALVLKDRVKETSTTTGTGSFTLGGTSTGFQSFSAIGDGSTTYYGIVNSVAGEWEIGVGTYTASGTVLSRDTILESSNGGSAVNFSAGTKDVFATYPAEKAVSTDTFATPPAIGSTTPAAGTFTTLIGGGGSANYGQLTGGATTNAVEFTTLGTDTNIAAVIKTKGTGAIDLAAGSRGVNISNGGTVTVITRTAFGSSYTSVPTVAISAPTTAGGVQATASAEMSNNTIPTIISGGTGYTVGDSLTVVGGTFTFALRLTVSSVSGGVVTGVTISNVGQYSVIPAGTLSVTGGTGTGATFTFSNWYLSASITITNAGSGYVEQPTVTFSGGGGSGAAAYATVGSGTVVRSLGAALDFYTPNQQIAFRVQDFSGSAATGYWTAFGGNTTPILRAVGANSGAIQTASGVPIQFGTNNGVEQLRVSHTASAVNYVQVTGAATGGGVAISAQGSDANIALNLKAKGGQPVTTEFYHRVGVGYANYFQITGNGTGVAPVLSVLGTDTNIDLTLTPKGTGNVRFGTLTASADAPITGYITIKDSGGTVCKLAVIA